MRTREYAKLLREGEYVAEVNVHLIEAGEGWAPYLSLQDAERLDEVRIALRNGDVEKAGRLAKIYRLMPVDDAA